MKFKLGLILFVITIYSCIPSAFLSSNSTCDNKKASPVYLSISGSISQKEVVFRQKLSSALSIRGYFVVDNFQQSDYFLLINFDSNNKKQPIKNYDEDWISLKFSLIESKQIFSHSKLQFDRKDAIWVCRMELGALEFFKYQDNIADIVSKTICKSYFGKKIII